MITIKYYCDETKQAMTATVQGKDEGAAELKFEFDPPVSDGTKDPYGIMGRLLDALRPGE